MEKGTNNFVNNSIPTPNTPNHTSNPNNNSSNNQNQNQNQNKQTGANTFNNAMGMINANTNGNVTFGTNTRATEGSDTVAQSAYYAGTSGFRTEENYVYQDKVQLHRAAGVMSLVAGDFQKISTVNNYNNIRFTDASTQNFLQNVGYAGTRQSVELNRFGFNGRNNREIESAKINGLSVVKDQNGNIVRSFDKTDKTGLNNFLNSSSSNGTKYSVSTISGATFADHMLQAKTEDDRYKRLVSAGSHSDKIAAMNELRDAATAHFKKDYNIEIRPGTNLAKLISDAKKQGNTKLANELTQYKEMGLHNCSRNTMSGLQKQGIRTIATSVVGEEMMTGYRFYSNVGRIAKSSARISLRAVGGTLRLGESTAHKAIQMVAPTSKIAGVSNKIHDVSQNGTKRSRRRAETKRARAEGTLKELKKQRRDERKVRNLQKRTAKDNKLLAKQAKYRKNNSKVRLEITNKRLGVRNGVNHVRNQFALFKGRGKDLVNAIKKSRFGKTASFFKKGAEFAFAPVKFIKNRIIKFVNFLNKAKKVIIIAIVGAFAVWYIGVIGFSALIGYAIHFISEPSTLASNLDDINYVQYIVDKAAETVGIEAVDVAQRDAKVHFLLDSFKVGSDNLDWNKNVGDASLGKIVASEDITHELMGPNDNLPPITSMMHYRMLDDLDFDSYPNAMAYEFYMYVASHDIYYDGAGYEVNNNHDYAVLGTHFDWNPSTYVVSRSDAGVCDNIYYHGYDANMGNFINNARRSSLDFLNGQLKKMSDILPGTYYIGSGKENGVWLNEIPHDSKGTCANYTIRQGGLHCGKQTHIHTDGCYKKTQVKGANGKTYTKLELTCDKGHIHTDACYDKYYICLGHCGGHITPVVNMKIDMTYDSLVKHDGFKTPYFIGESDVTNFLTHASNNLMPTYAAWKWVWNTRASSWFSPLPNSLCGFTEWLTTHTIEAAAEGIDGLVNTAKSQVTGMQVAPSNKDTADDIYKFRGWAKDTDPKGSLNAIIKKDLESIYGSFDDEYESCKKNWEDFDVVFPAGTVRPLTDAQITYILETVKAQNPGISENRLKVIEQALRGVGKFWYSLNGNGHENGLHNTQGASECSGFIGGCLNRAFGVDRNWGTAAGFNNSSGPAKCGDILSHANGGSNYSGHVVLYIGYLPDLGTYECGNKKVKCGGSGTYIIDCTSGDVGGSSIRRYNNPTNTYNHIFRPQGFGPY